MTTAPTKAAAPVTAERVIDQDDYGTMLDLTGSLEDILCSLAHKLHHEHRVGALAELGNPSTTTWRRRQLLRVLVPLIKTLSVTIGPDEARELAEQIDASTVEPWPCANDHHGWLNCPNYAMPGQPYCAPCDPDNQMDALYELSREVLS